MELWHLLVYGGVCLAVGTVLGTQLPATRERLHKAILHAVDEMGAEVDALRTVEEVEIAKAYAYGVLDAHEAHITNRARAIKTVRKVIHEARR